MVILETLNTLDRSCEIYLEVIHVESGPKASYDYLLFRTETPSISVVGIRSAALTGDRAAAHPPSVICRLVFKKDDRFHLSHLTVKFYATKRPYKGGKQAKVLHPLIMNEWKLGGAEVEFEKLCHFNRDTIPPLRTFDSLTEGFLVPERHYMKLAQVKESSKGEMEAEKVVSYFGSIEHNSNENIPDGTSKKSRGKSESSSSSEEGQRKRRKRSRKVSTTEQPLPISSDNNPPETEKDQTISYSIESSNNSEKDEKKIQVPESLIRLLKSSSQVVLKCEGQELELSVSKRNRENNDFSGLSMLATASTEENYLFKATSILTASLFKEFSNIVP